MAGVAAGSLAEAVGLGRGDEVLAVNGVDLFHKDVECFVVHVA